MPVSVKPRTLWTALAVVVAVGILALGALWLLGRRETPVELAPPAAESTVTITYAGEFPGGDGVAPLDGPRGIAADSQSLYVAESDAGRIRVFGHDGAPRGEIALPTAPGTSRAYPVDVAVLDDGRLAVVDTAGAAGRVVLVPLDSSAETTPGMLGTGDEQPRRPTAVASWEGRLYVADAGDRSVRVFDPASGRLLDRLATELDPRLTFVTGMDVRGGRVYVSDSNAGRLVVFDVKTGRQASTLDQDFSLPRGLDTEDGGHIFVADVFGRSVYVLDQGGRVVDAVGPQGKSPGGRDLEGTLGKPEGLVWIASSERLYVTDAGSGVVRVYNVRF